MPKSILIDLNIILDALFQRPGFTTSRDILQLAEKPDYKLFISAHAVTTFAYLLEAEKITQPEILDQVGWLVRKFSVVTVDLKLLQAALASKITDYEDAVIEQAALSCQATAIITRNLKDFKNSAVKAMSPEAYAKQS